VKKYTSQYRYNGKEYCLSLKAKSFDHANNMIENAYRTGDLTSIDFETPGLTHEEKLLRIRCSYFNGETQQVILTVPLTF